MSVEIEKMLVLSTGHITREASEWLETEEPAECGLIVDSHPYGWQLRAGPYEIPIEVPFVCINEAIAFALKHDCKWIRFDADGDFVSELHCYDW